MSIMTNDQRSAIDRKGRRGLRAKGVSHLIYAKFIYGNKRRSSLVEFKRRNGFQQIKLSQVLHSVNTERETIRLAATVQRLQRVDARANLATILSLRAWYYKTDLHQAHFTTAEIRRCSLMLERLISNQ